MNYVFNQEDIQVFELINVRWIEFVEPWISGMGRKNGKLFTWQATAKTSGWLVEITSVTGHVGNLQGATFNLPLEVAHAASRLL